MQKKMKIMVSHSKAHNNIEEKYIRQVRLLLPRTKNGKAFLTGLKKDLHAYLCKYPDSTMNDIYEVYGTPTNAVQYYLREQDEDDLKQLLSLRKWKRIIYVCCITVPIALATVFSVNIWYWHNVKEQVLTNIREKTDDTTTYSMGDEELWEKIP